MVKFMRVLGWCFFIISVTVILMLAGAGMYTGLWEAMAWMSIAPLVILFIILTLVTEDPIAGFIAAIIIYLMAAVSGAGVGYGLKLLEGHGFKLLEACVG